MEFRQRGQRDERRRRVLMDELRDRSDSDGFGDEEPGGAGAGPRRTYSEAALESRQPALTCIVPRRLWTLTVAFLSGLVLIASLAAIQTLVYEAAPGHLRTAMRALDMAERGSMAAWLGSLLLAGAAVYSAAAYHLRRHKLDDYRGRYRVWITAILGLACGSLVSGTGLQDLASVLMVQAVGLPLLGDGSIWGMLTIGGAFALLALRMLVEIRQSRLAVAFSSCATLLYGLTIAIELETGATLRAYPQRELIAASSLLIGHLCVLMIVLSYCRYVYLDAQGELKKRLRAEPHDKVQVKKKAATPKATAAKRKSVENEKRSAEMPKVKVRPTLRVDAAHESPAPASSQSSETSAAEEHAEPEGGKQKQSKAERRRQRKLLKQQNRG